MILCFNFLSQESALMYPMLITGIVGLISIFQPLRYLSKVRLAQIISSRFNYDLLKFSYPFMFVIILQTFVKSFDDGSLHAATRQYDSAPSSFAFCAFVTTSSGVGN